MSDMPPCFKAYDIRGKVPSEINAGLAYALGQALGEIFRPGDAALAYDARLSGPMLANALAAGLKAAGLSQIVNLGMAGTEEIYHAAQKHDLGIMITGSHNPADENGFKIVKRGAIPVSSDSGLNQIGSRAAEILMRAGAGKNCESAAMPVDRELARRYRSGYIAWALRYSGLEKLNSRKSLKVVADAGNGCAGLVLRELAAQLPINLIGCNFEPDGNFPNGVPNPLLPERRADTSRAVLENAADIGIAFDGDFDRCFFYDQNGNFIESYYMVGLLASQLLRGHQGAKIVHDPRLYWNTREMTARAGGKPVMGKTGHAFMKEKMRAENALYGGEMSAHHYFRDFAYCDSGILTMLTALAFLLNSDLTLAELLESRMAAYPCSGEINFRIAEAGAAMRAVLDKYGQGAVYMDKVDGINLEFRQWRFNLRQSNTEALLRLNVESRGDRQLMTDMTEEISSLILKSQPHY